VCSSDLFSKQRRPDWSFEGRMPTFGSTMSRGSLALWKMHHFPSRWPNWNSRAYLGFFVEDQTLLYWAGQAAWPIHRWLPDRRIVIRRRHGDRRHRVPRRRPTLPQRRHTIAPRRQSLCTRTAQPLSSQPIRSRRPTPSLPRSRSHRDGHYANRLIKAFARCTPPQWREARQNPPDRPVGC
jgi:hypothetical protein